MEDIKYMNIKDFRDKGFLQEVNRQFFHPLGLALEVAIDDDSGACSLGGIWDYRDDPEGMFFDNKVLKTEEASDKAEHIEKLRESKVKIRINHEEFNCDFEGVQQFPEE